MANKPITVTINTEKIIKGEMFKGKNGSILDLVIWPNRDGEGQYGDTHYCVQDISKASKERGAKGPIIGNAKVPQQEPPARPAAPARPAPPAKPAASALDDNSDDDIPF